MIRRGDDQGVYVPAPDQLAEIVISRATLESALRLFRVVIFDNFLRVFAAVRIDIAHGDGLRFLFAEEPAHQTAALRPKTDETQGEAVVGLDFRGPNARGQHERRGA